MEDIINYIYPIVGLVSMYGYIPQIKDLMKKDADLTSMSVPMWFLWSVTGVISVLYTMIKVDDLMMNVTLGVETLLIIVVTGIIIHRRKSYLNVLAQCSSIKLRTNEQFSRVVYSAVFISFVSLNYYC
ncbi:MAG: hypothetical protein H6860_01450 [Rhodospirillales bacterium]|nr:hypothetical protein [Rhodospirillales bacterium]HRV95962.1 hypothetical protein [Anaerolineae bacterium]